MGLPGRENSGKKGGRKTSVRLKTSWTYHTEERLLGHIAKHRLKKQFNLSIRDSGTILKAKLSSLIRSFHFIICGLAVLQKKKKKKLLLQHGSDIRE